MQEKEAANWHSVEEEHDDRLGPLKTHDGLPLPRLLMPSNGAESEAECYTARGTALEGYENDVSTG